MKQYMSDADLTDPIDVYGYSVARPRCRCSNNAAMTSRATTS